MSRNHKIASVIFVTLFCLGAALEEPLRDWTGFQGIRTKSGPLYDVITYGAAVDGSTDDETAIEAAITAATVSGGIVYIPNTGSACKFNDSITVPLNVTLKFETGASLMGDGSATISVANIDAGLHQIFQSTITVTTPNGGLGKVQAAWWGFDTTASGATNKTAILSAMNAISSVEASAVNGGIVELHRGDFTVAADVNLVNAFFTVTGAAQGIGYDGTIDAATTITFEAGTNGFALGTGGTTQANGADFVTLENMRINGADLITSGVWLSGSCTVRNVTVTNATNGFHFGAYCNQSQLIDSTATLCSAYNCLSDNTSNTVMNVIRCNFRSGDDVGLGITAGLGMRAQDTVIESNGGYGLYIYNQDVPANENHTFEHCWFENNTTYAVAINSYNATTAEPTNIAFKQCNFDQNINIVAGNTFSFEHCYGGSVLAGANANNVVLTYDEYGTTLTNSGGDDNYVMNNPTFLAGAQVGNGTNSAPLRLDADSSSSKGAGVYFQKDGVQTAAIGHQSVILGGTVNPIVFFSNGPDDWIFYNGDVEVNDNILADGLLAYRGTPQSLSGAGAINATTAITEFTSTGGAQALTIANGTIQGQIKKIYHIVDGGDGNLTGANFLGTSLNFANAGDGAALSWSISQSKWICDSTCGAVFTP